MRRGFIVDCALAREAISALADGEEPPIAEAVADSHLARCEACRRFQSRIRSLTRETSVAVLPPIADRTSEIVALLTTLDHAQTACAAKGRPRGDRRSGSWGRATQWVASVVPLGVAVPSLALGLFSHTHVVASHVLTPCTMLLVHHVAR